LGVVLLNYGMGEINWFRRFSFKPPKPPKPIYFIPGPIRLLRKIMNCRKTKIRMGRKGGR